MVTYFSIILGLDCLASVMWPYPLTAFTFRSCLYCANVSHYKDVWTVNFIIIRSPNLNASVIAQHKHICQQWEQWGWMVRLMKLSNNELGKWLDGWPFGIHAFCPFFSLAMIGRNIRQISLILLFSLNFRKTQMADLKFWFSLADFGTSQTKYLTSKVISNTTATHMNSKLYLHKIYIKMCHWSHGSFFRHIAVTFYHTNLQTTNGLETT